MNDERQSFTVGVFQDTEWAQRGLKALVDEGFPPESLSMIAQDSPEAAALLQRTFGVDPTALDIVRLGSVLAHGPFVKTLQGPSRDLDRSGVSATIRRAGFQTHDGFIFETLTARGGVLVAVHSEPRAADALAVMFAYGGGNAAIGAWSGRV
ncbi:MAG: hypothetical protein O3A25_14475 [Acidobacteria bacterium]|nr:hypothetical protein [Acidobacteriota bacterium]